MEKYYLWAHNKIKHLRKALKEERGKKNRSATFATAHSLRGPFTRRIDASTRSVGALDKVNHLKELL